ncbi:uncharacterized protein G2W53_043476 [Senna tora]|uniref:Uncharacterized protein n=1 Tax=Senna tora TaxID=362788 RepID=A0A834W0L0_9FABA|nr:uncharacterized protein G2W53_043476 [Senna tora]
MAVGDKSDPGVVPNIAQDGPSFSTQCDNQLLSMNLVKRCCHNFLTMLHVLFI